MRAAAAALRARGATRYDACSRRNAAIVTTLIVTHGGLAQELLAAAHRIVGETRNLSALSLDWDDSFEEASRKLRHKVAELPRADGLLILTDIYGGTPNNVALTLRSPGAVEVVSGVNLPMVVRLGCLEQRPEMSLTELADWIQDKARSSICRCDGGGQPNSNEGHGGA